MMQQRNGRSLAAAEHTPAAEIASNLLAAQQRAVEQRLAVEVLLAEARSLEERLESELLAARAVAERELAQERAADAIVAAQLEREAIVEIESCEAELAVLALQNDALTLAVGQAREVFEAASAQVVECEKRLHAARAELEHATIAGTEANARRSDLAAARAAAEARAADAAQLLSQHRAARQAAENASREAEERALALGLRDGADHLPSIDPIEEVHLLETRVALRAEASKRAAERRASDAARSNVVH